MSDDSKVNLKSDGQRKQPQGEKPHGIRWLTSSAHGVAQRAKEMLHQGIENSGFSLFAERIKKLEEFLKNRKKVLPPVDYSDDLKPNFVSACEAANARLLDLNQTYGIFEQHEIEELSETARQLREKQILISFVGHVNVGKSTLLNALLGARLLPIKPRAETGIKVQIHHDAEDSCSAPTAASDKGCEGVYCTLKASVPLLANTPSNWHVVLVDTPGTGEFNSRVAVAAEGALKSSSAYVFVTTYGELESAENANFLRFLHKHDRGVFEDRRLIVVVTQFDKTMEPDGSGEEITVKKVQEEVCQSVREACPDVNISCDDVLPLSGLWAYHARMLTCQSDELEHRRCRKEVERCLQNYHSLPRGQGESVSSGLTVQKDDELAKTLLDASEFASLEARIRSVIESHIKVWVSKVKGDYERHLTQAKNKLCLQLISHDKEIDEDEKQHLQVEKYLARIDDQRLQLEASMKPKSTVWANLEKMYPNDLEDTKSLQLGKSLVHMEMENFEQQCFRKVKDYSAVFGPQEFEQDLNKFLKELSEELEQAFNGTCAFSGLHTVIMGHALDTGGVVAEMRTNAQQLCTTLGLRPVHIKTEVGEEEGSSIIPSLGSIKDKIDIP